MATLFRCETCPLPGGSIMAVDVCDGTSPPIILLHGIPGSRLTWRLVGEHLAGEHAVLAPDLLGFGRSSDPTNGFHADAQAAALLELMAARRIPAAHFVGFDFGGPVAISVCRLAPHRVLTLTLAATNAFTDTPILAPLGLAHVPVAGDLLFAALCSWPGLASLWMTAVRDKRTLLWSDYIRTIPDRRGRRWTRRIFLDSLRHLEARYAAIQATLPRIGCPTTVLWGDADPFFPIAVGERTANAITGAEFHVWRQCGHFLPLERPLALATSVRQIVTTFERASRNQHIVEHGQHVSMPRIQDSTAVGP